MKGCGHLTKGCGHLTKGCGHLTKESIPLVKKELEASVDGLLQKQEFMNKLYALRDEKLLLSHPLEHIMNLSKKLSSSSHSQMKSIYDEAIRKVEKQFLELIPDTLFQDIQKCIHIPKFFHHITFKHYSNDITIKCTFNFQQLEHLDFDIDPYVGIRLGGWLKVHYILIKGPTSDSKEEYQLYNQSSKKYFNDYYFIQEIFNLPYGHFIYIAEGSFQTDTYLTFDILSDMFVALIQYDWNPTLNNH